MHIDLSYIPPPSQNFLGSLGSSGIARPLRVSGTSRPIRRSRLLKKKKHFLTLQFLQVNLMSISPIVFQNIYTFIFWYLRNFRQRIVSF